MQITQNNTFFSFSFGLVHVKFKDYNKQNNDLGRVNAPHLFFPLMEGKRYHKDDF